MELAIETHQLCKTFRGLLKRPQVAVDELSLAVPRGSVFGLLGPNGSGKTTTIMMLLGNLRPTGGQARLLGRPVGDVQARRRLGFLPEKFQFHDFLSAEEFLDLHGKLYGLDAATRRRRIDETLDLVDLASRRKDRLRSFSKGMQQRIGLAQALLADPELVILDEPTSALDPLGRRLVREIVLGLKRKGCTVLINSHLLSEIELTCDEVAILRRGRTIQQGSVEELTGTHNRLRVVVENLTDPVREALSALGALKTVGPGELEIDLHDGRSAPDVAEAVVRSGGRLARLETQRESLEELFVRVVEDGE